MKSKLLFLFGLLTLALSVRSQTLSFTTNKVTLTQGDSVTFTNTSTGFPGGQIFVWRFGDDCLSSVDYDIYGCEQLTTGAAATIKHTYNLMGTVKARLMYQVSPGVYSTTGYEVTLTITQDYNCVVNPPAPGTCELAINGDFEFDTKPASQLNVAGLAYKKACPWDNAQGHSGSPDLFGLSGVGNFDYGNYAGNQLPQSGNNYLGIVTCNVDATPCSPPYRFREYLQQKLNAPLTTGVTYVVKFWVSLSEFSGKATKIGVHLSTTPTFGTINSSSTYYPGPGICQLITDNGPITGVTSLTYITPNVITEKNDWVPIEFTVVGAGQQYLTIGYYNDLTNTDVITVSVTNPNNGWPNRAYYYIDNVSVHQDCCMPANFTVSVASPNSSNIISSNLGNPVVTNKTIFVGSDLTINQNITFTGCQIIMASGTNINVQAGKTLTINDYTYTYGGNTYSAPSYVYAGCSQMWNSIKLPATATLNMSNSFVLDGNIAVESSNGGMYTITNTTFNKNYIGVKVQNGGSFMGVLNGNKFKCNQTITLAPHAGQVATAGLQGRTTTNINIGSNTYNPNIFDARQQTGTLRGLTNGITADACGLTVFNNQFNYCNNGLNTTNVPATASLYSQIGSTLSAAHGNLFIDCFRGIYMANKQKLDISGNTFNATAAANAFFGIYISDDIFVPAENNKIAIFDNLLYNQRNGIYVGNINPNNTAAEIKKNTILQQTAGLINLRKGVQLNNANQPSTTSLQVTDNIVDYGTSVTNANVTSCTSIDIFDDCNRFAVYASNCIAPTILDNYFYRNLTPVAGTPDKLVGVYTEYCPRALVKENYMQGFGSGILSLGDNSNILYQCNVMDNCFNMFRFNTAILGRQGTPAFLGNPDAPWDNKWFTLAGGTTGTYNSSSLAVDWYIRNTNVAGNPYNIQPLSVTPLFKILPQYSKTGSAPCTPPARYAAPQPTPVQTDGDAAALVNSVAQNQTEYINYIPQSRYWATALAYEMADADSTMRDENGGTEGNIKLFYNTQKNTNIGFIHALNKFAAQTNAAAFDSLNNLWQPQNQMEEYRKTVNTIYAATILSGRSDLTPEEIDILIPIAYDNPLWGGDAVYSARALLQISHPAEGTDINEEKNSNTDDKPLVNLYPNPANTTVTINYNLGGNDAALFELVDLNGNRADAFTLYGKTGILPYSTEKLKAGVYLYRVSNATGVISTGKLVIIKQ